MTNNQKHLIHLTFCVMFLTAMIIACGKNPSDQTVNKNNAEPLFNSFRDVPGVTQDEIKAIESLQNSVDYFVYGSTPSTEAFIAENGEIGGFNALFCDWLTSLFGIQFQPAVFEWNDILAGLKTGAIDFCNLMVTDGRLKIYNMTDPIAEHSLKVMQIQDSASIDKISLTRPVRYVFMEDSATIDVATGTLTPGTYEVILAQNYDNAYQLIKSGDGDAFVEYGMAEAAFDAYSDVVIEDFFPLIFSPVSMAAENPDFAPIISVITKALKNGGIQHLNTLYKNGHDSYMRNQFLKRLNDEEKEYLRNNSVVPVLAAPWFYPLVYYNKYEKRWEGIGFDTLDEVTKITGLEFKMANAPENSWAEIYQMLNDGKAPICLDLIRNPERSSRYLWSKHTYMAENYALISKHDLPNISIGEIKYAKIGLIKSTSWAEMFEIWFPGAINVTMYPSQDAAFLAMDRGEVDLIMAGTNALSSITFYYEFSNYKANYIFNSTIDYVIAYNLGEDVLCSLIDKALDYVDLDIISKQWENKTFDYQTKMMRAQRPWLIGAVILSLSMFVLIFVLFQMSRLAGKRLKNTLEQLQVTWDNSESSVVIVDAETRNIIDINPAVTRIFGDSRDNIVGQPCSKIFCTEDGCPILDKNQVLYQAERYFKRSSGETLPIIKSVTKIRYNGRPALLESFSDISYVKKVEEAESASEAKSRFIANMSHEMRTPLNVVVGLTDLMLEEKEPENVKENLSKINTAGNTLLGLISDVLDISKIEAGKFELTPVQYDVPSLLNDIVTLNIIRIEDKPITFRLDISQDLLCTLQGDDLRVKQIANNILSNAFKYTRKGTVVFGMSCSRAEGNDVWTHFYVSDTGIGIREDELGKLFSDYNQLDTMANRNIGGTGLGLSITKKLAELMGGEISVESEYGVGTTFRVRIKQGFVNDETIGEETVNNLCGFRYTDNKKKAFEKFVRPNLSYAKVLVVDDMQSNLDVAAGLLRKYKMHVDCVLSGQAAIDKIEDGEPVYNAIFMDHMMPKMDGIEAADAIRALGTEYAQKIPIIALTANAIQGTAKMFHDHGFQGFISKPIDIMEMDTVIRKWVRNKNYEGTLIDETPESDESSESDDVFIEIPGVDAKRGLSLYEGDMKMYLSLLRSYVTNTPGILDKLRNVSEETLPDYVVTVHGLKSVSGGIGAESIRGAAMKLETLSRAGDLSGVLARNGILIEDAEALVADIKKWLDEYNAQNVKLHLKAPDKNTLALLRQSCENYDMGGIDKAISELEKYDYEEGAGLVAWLIEKINRSEIGEVAQRLANYEEDMYT